jgi:hypothetical protein
MAVPQVVVSKRLRRQLKNGEVPDDLISLGIFELEESKETPRPTVTFAIHSPRPSPSPSPSPPLSEENNTIKLEKSMLKKSNLGERKQSSERRASASTSSSSTSPPHSTHKKKFKHMATNPSQPTTEDMRASLVGFVIVSLSVLVLLLGDQDLFVPLYRLMSPVPTNFNFIPHSERFYDSRILSTGILTPADGEITSSSTLKWWVDGAFLVPGGEIGKRNVTFRVFYNDKQLQFPEGNTIELTLQGKVDTPPLLILLSLRSNCKWI